MSGLPDFDDDAWNAEGVRLTEMLKAVALLLLTHSGGANRLTIPLDEAHTLTIERIPCKRTN
jgi:hypothetical protein